MSAPNEQLWEETFRHVARHSPYYRKLFRGVKRTPVFESVPVIDKSVVSARARDFLCVPRASIAEIVTTSGTSGEPLVWMLTERDLERLAVNEQWSFECAGVTARDTVFVAVAMDRCFIAGLAYALGLRKLGAAVARVGPSSPLLVLDMMQRLQPTAIVAVPSFLRLAAAKAQESGFDLARSSVKRIIAIGEPVREPDFSLNSSGRALADAWPARVFSTYGVTELANSLCECRAGAGGHLHEEHLFLEALDESGNAVADGEVGEIVATTFGVEGMPLLRYRTGDFAALHRGVCRCGRTSPRLGPVVGRKSQRLKLKGASIFPATLTGALESVPGVESFVVVARQDQAETDMVEALYHGSASVAAVREALQARARVAPRVQRVSKRKIEELQMPPTARKRRTFVDLR